MWLKGKTKSGWIIQGLIVFVLFNFSLVCISQPNRRVRIEYIKFRDSAKEVIDLTSIAEERCTETLSRIVGKNSILLKFQPEFRNEAERIIDGLESAVRETQGILNPLEIEDLQVFVLQINEVPTNYKMVKRAENRQFYLQLFAFKNREDLSLDLCNAAGLCGEIFGTVPHELVHTALDGLVSRKGTRWFNDGLAKYVENTVYEKLSPLDFMKELEPASPQVSLYRRDIRKNILQWKEPGLGILKITRRELSNEIYHYLAAYELVRQIVEKANEKDIKNPLGILLAKLKAHRNTARQPAGADDLISIIKEYLRVDPTTLGDLDLQTQKNLVNEAISLLSKDDLTTEKKNYALYNLASLDEIKLPDKVIIYLLDQIYNHKTSDNNQRDIVATALVVRFNQEGFTELMKTYASGKPELKGKSIKKIKSELAEFSLRPRPRENEQGFSR
jgi:hypothetical protein